jgi:hypothetical protein
LYYDPPNKATPRTAHGQLPAYEKFTQGDGVMLYLLIGLQVLDLLTTVIALRNPKLTEGNGLLKPLFERFGVLPTLIVVKLAFVGLLWWAAPQVPVELLYLLCAGYCWIVFNNVKLIRSH